MSHICGVHCPYYHLIPGKGLKKNPDIWQCILGEDLPSKSDLRDFQVSHKSRRDLAFAYQVRQTLCLHMYSTAVWFVGAGLGLRF